MKAIIKNLLVVFLDVTRPDMYLTESKQLVLAEACGYFIFVLLTKLPSLKSLVFFW